MKTRTFAGMVAVSIAALLAGAATAQAVNPPQAQAARHANIDPDNDGRISQAEFVQARTARLSVLDTDRDGLVTAAERRAGMQARRDQRASLRFDRLDADKNGEISRTEFDAVRASRAEAGRAGAHRVRQGARPGLQHRVRLAGRAHNVSRGPDARMATRQPMSIANAQTRAAEAFARLDLNHDGMLNASEALRSRGDRMGQARRMARPMASHRAGHRPHAAVRPMMRPAAPATPASPSAPASE